MKTTLKILALVAMASVLALTTCTKDDEHNYSYNSETGNGNGNGNGGETEQRPNAYFTSDAGQFYTYTDTPIYFTNKSTNATRYSWNFGDYTTSTLTNPSHTYSSYGRKTVTLTAYNSQGYSDTYSQTLNIVPKRAYISHIDITNWPSRNNGNVWDQFATSATSHPDIFFKISQSGSVVFTSEVIDNCIHPSDGGTTSPSFEVGRSFVPATYTITFYDEDTIENVEMGSTSFNLYTLGNNNDYPSVLTLSGGGFSFKIY